MPPRISSYMTSPVIVAKAEDTLAYIRNLMIRHGIGRIVIVDNMNRPIGVITRKDLIKEALKQYTKPLDTILVKDVISKGVITVKSNRSIKYAAKLMIKHNVSGLPVVDANGVLEGIITKTDLTKAYAERYKGLMKVSEALRRDIPIVNPLHTLYYVVSLISQSDLGKVIVVDNNRPIGVITEKDVAFTLEDFNIRDKGSKYKKRIGISPRGTLAVVRDYVVPLAQDLMSQNVIIAREDMDLSDVASLMIENNISIVPVVDNEGFFVGAVSKTEIVKALLKV